MSESIKITELPSGLKVVSERIEHVETVSVGAYVAVGAGHEASEENGLSHFLEHMAFKGTATRSAGAIAEETENVGGRINAYTSREQTVYYAGLLKEDLRLGTDILGDILTHSVFDKDEMQKERGVILQEIGLSNDTPDDIIFDFFQSRAYQNQSFGRPILGSEALIKSYTSQSLRSYLEKHYSTKNTIIAAAGALSHAELVKYVEEYFADLPQHIPPPPSDTVRYTGGEFREMRELDQTHIILGFEACAYHDPDYYPTMILSVLSGGGMSSRLFQEIREKRGLVYTISTFFTPYKKTGVFGIYAGTGEEQAAELLPVVTEELCKIQTELREEEITRAKAQLKAGLLMGLESTGARCERLARHLELFGRIIPPQETVKKIEAVTKQDVERVAARIFSSPLTIASLGPVGRVLTLDETTSLLRR